MSTFPPRIDEEGFSKTWVLGYRSARASSPDLKVNALRALGRLSSYSPLVFLCPVLENTGDKSTDFVGLF